MPKAAFLPVLVESVWTMRNAGGFCFERVSFHWPRDWGSYYSGPAAWLSAPALGSIPPPYRMETLNYFYI